MDIINADDLAIFLMLFLAIVWASLWVSVLLLWGVQTREQEEKRLAVCLLLVRDGKILSIDRCKKSGVARDFGLPGGKVEKGESLVAALAREIQEETGLMLEGAPTLVFMRFDGEFETYTFTAPVGGFIRSSPEGEVSWEKPQDLLAECCTFREYNRQLFAEMEIEVQS